MVSKTPVFSIEHFQQTVKRCLIKTGFCLVFRFYGQVFKVQFSLPKGMSIQIVSGGGKHMKAVFAWNF